MKKRRMLSVLLIGTMTAGLIAGCGARGSGSDSDEGSVYFLNFKPEVSEVWTEIAESYTEQTGVEVKIQTAASGTYE